MTLEQSSFWIALLGHFSLLGLMFVQIRLPEKTLPAPPIIFDLENLQVQETSQTQEEQIPIPKKSPEAIKKTVAAMPDVAPVPEPDEDIQPIENEVEQDAVSVEKEKPKDKMEKIPFPEIKPKRKPDIKPKAPVLKEAAPKPEAKENSLKTLLASVEKISERIEKQDKEVSTGTNGKKAQEVAPVITTSELDFIAQTIRKHWNLDAGVSGVNKMLIEVKVFLDMSGNVYHVEFLDTTLYGKDTAYTSVADSAQRAIYICDKLGDESPFKKLAKKHNGAYSEWKELTLRFTP